MPSWRRDSLCSLGKAAQSQGAPRRREWYLCLVRVTNLQATWWYIIIMNTLHFLVCCYFYLGTVHIRNVSVYNARLIDFFKKCCPWSLFYNPGRIAAIHSTHKGWQIHCDIRFHFILPVYILSVIHVPTQDNMPCIWIVGIKLTKTDTVINLLDLKVPQA